MKKLVALLCILVVSVVMAGSYECSFAKGKWNEADWILVKSPRWDYIGAWIQQEDRLQNKVPTDATELELQGKRATETFTSMVYRKPMEGGKITFSATMDFDFQMAPELVLAAELSANKDGYPQYAEYWEIVLYDKGLNVWHHEIKDGKPFWRKAAYLEVPYLPKKKYVLQGEVVFTSKCPQLTVTCEGHKFGCMLPTLPKNCFVGITGCEGINHFYDFKVTYTDAKKPAAK